MDEVDGARGSVCLDSGINDKGRGETWKHIVAAKTHRGEE